MVAPLPRGVEVDQGQRHLPSRGCPLPPSPEENTYQASVSWMGPRQLSSPVGGPLGWQPGQDRLQLEKQAPHLIFHSAQRLRRRVKQPRPPSGAWLPTSDLRGCLWAHLGVFGGERSPPHALGEGPMDRAAALGVTDNLTRTLQPGSVPGSPNSRLGGVRKDRLHVSDEETLRTCYLGPWPRPSPHTDRPPARHWLPHCSSHKAHALSNKLGMAHPHLSHLILQGPTGHAPSSKRPWVLVYLPGGQEPGYFIPTVSPGRGTEP